MRIPAGNFSHVRSLSISGDVKWLAVSGEAHAKVWDLAAGHAVFELPGFSSSWFSPGDSLIVDLPKQKEHEREFLVLNPAGKNFEKGPEIKDDMATEYGPYLLVTKSADGNVYHRSSSGGYLMNVVMELHDALTSKLFWSKPFKEAPTVWFSHHDKRMVMGWGAETETGQAEIKADAAIHRRWNDLDDKQSAIVYDVMNAETGEVQSRLLVDTGNHSFSIRYGELVGPHLALQDDQYRCVVYSLATREIVGRAFGWLVATDTASPEIGIQDGPGAITIYSLPSMRKLAQYQFAAFVTSLRFQADGKQLVAITEDQQAVRVAVPSGALDPQPE